MSQDLLFTHYLALSLGVLFLALSVVGLILRARFVAGAKAREATVSNVGVVANRSTTVRYREADGREREAHLVGGGRSVRPVGTALSVLVHPDQPGRVIENAWRDVWGRPLTGILVGVALVTFHLVRSR